MAQIHADRVYAAASESAALSPIAASWRRSLVTHRLRPEEKREPRRLAEAEFTAARKRASALVEGSADELDRLAGMVARAGCCLILTDADGVALDRRGAPGDDDDFRRSGLWTGAVWSEASVGTNGIGTSLAEDRAVTIYRDQHFLADNVGLSCTTAPIRDHAGRLAGAIDISTCRDDADEIALTILAQAARDAAGRIEAVLFRRAFAAARIVLGAQPSNGRPALVAVDKDDLVLGATRAARQTLKISDAMIEAGLPAADLLDDDGRSEARDHLAQAERAALRRALSRAGGNVSAAAASLGVSRATLHRKIRRFALN
jgi:transcriptional regulator of acetoin/glycerol metabolism